MKTLGKIWLVIIFVPLFLNLLVAISIKFQLLNADFWIENFRAGKVYPTLETVFKKELETSLKKEGASAREIQPLVSLVTAPNLQEFFEKNLTNLFAFANGRSESFVIFVPVNKLPKGLLPPAFAKENLDFADLLTTFGGEQALIGYDPIRNTGLAATATLVISAVFLGLSLWGLYRLTQGGRKLTLPGVALIVSAVITGLIVGAVNAMKGSVAQDLTVPGREPAQILLGTLAPPLVIQITKLWGIIAAITGALGIGFLFVTKPSKSSKKV